MCFCETMPYLFFCFMSKMDTVKVLVEVFILFQCSAEVSGTQWTLCRGQMYNVSMNYLTHPNALSQCSRLSAGSQLASFKGMQPSDIKDMFNECNMFKNFVDSGNYFIDNEGVYYCKYLTISRGKVQVARKPDSCQFVEGYLVCQKPATTSDYYNKWLNVTNSTNEYFVTSSNGSHSFCVQQCKTHNSEVAYADEDKLKKLVDSYPQFSPTKPKQYWTVSGGDCLLMITHEGLTIIPHQGFDCSLPVQCICQRNTKKTTLSTPIMGSSSVSANETSSISKVASVSEYGLSDFVLLRTTVAEFTVTNQPLSSSLVTQLSVTDQPLSSNLVTRLFSVTNQPLSSSLMTQFSVMNQPLSSSLMKHFSVTNQPLSLSLVTQFSVTDQPLSLSLVTQFSVTDQPLSASFVTHFSVTDQPLSSSMVTEFSAMDQPLSSSLVTEFSVTNQPLFSSLVRSPSYSLHQSTYSSNSERKSVLSKNIGASVSNFKTFFANFGSKTNAVTSSTHYALQTSFISNSTNQVMSAIKTSSPNEWSTWMLQSSFSSEIDRLAPTASAIIAATPVATTFGSNISSVSAVSQVSTIAPSSKCSSTLANDCNISSSDRWVTLGKIEVFVNKNNLTFNAAKYFCKANLSARLLTFTKVGRYFGAIGSLSLAASDFWVEDSFEASDGSCLKLNAANPALEVDNCNRTMYSICSRANLSAILNDPQFERALTELTVQKNSTGKLRRTLTCADDVRTSATISGSFAIGILVGTLMLFVFADMGKVAQCMRRTRQLSADITDETTV